MKFSKILLAGSAFALSGVAFAATDGLLDTTSTGTADVTVIKQNAVQISEVDDIDLGSHPFLSADAVGSDDVCVFNSTGSYQITVSSAEGSFNLDSGTELMPYAVTWDGVDATAGVLTGLTGDSSDPTCGGGTNATFEVTVASADFNAAAPGTYSDTLTLFVEPE